MGLALKGIEIENFKSYTAKKIHSAVSDKYTDNFGSRLKKDNYANQYGF